VTDRLAVVFTDEHSRSRDSQAEGTADFLAAQGRASQQRLLAMEKRLRTAKELHMGTLPEQTLANLQTLAGVRQQLESTHNAIISERDRLALTDRQIQNMKKSGTGPGGSAVVSPLQRVLALEAQLGEARAKYMDKHPEVTNLEEELKVARAAAAADQPADGARQALIESDPPTSTLLPSNLGDSGFRRCSDREAAPRRYRVPSRVERRPGGRRFPLQRCDLERENHKQLAERHPRGWNR
jgi:hypothetical protein